jgi:hypothetical protein
MTFKPEHLDPKTYTKDRNEEIARDNNRILQELLKDVPQDQKDHIVTIKVRWEGFHVILRNKGLKIDGEDVGESE